MNKIFLWAILIVIVLVLLFTIGMTALIGLGAAVLVGLMIMVLSTFVDVSASGHWKDNARVFLVATIVTLIAYVILEIAGVI